jgi:hypothetical protein
MNTSDWHDFAPGSGKAGWHFMIVRSGRAGHLAWQRRAAAMLAAPASRKMVMARQPWPFLGT